MSASTKMPITPGKWCAEDWGGPRIGIWSDVGDDPLRPDRGLIAWCSGPERVANARLIVAALDLVIAATAAHLVLREDRGQVARNAAEEILEEALTKATGLNMWTGEPVEGDAS